MALRATIFKLDLHVADMQRGYYASHALTLARHPSETDERLMLRVLAFAMHADEDVSFTRGLSTTDEPSVWQKDLTGDIKLWIEMGHPDERRLLQAAGKSDRVVVFCYGGHASKVWWQGVQSAASRIRQLTVYSVEPVSAQALARLVRRNMSLHASLDEDSILLSSDEESVSVELAVWCEAEAT
jgi:uncharacterized protein YaeQ